MARTGAYLRGANQGLGRLAQSLAMGGQSEEQAFQTAAGGQSKIMQALAAAQKDYAEAGAADEKAAVLARRPDLYEEQAALQSGVDVPTLRAYRESIRTGRMPQVEMQGPATPDGGALMADRVPMEKRGKIATALQRLAPFLSDAGDIGMKALADAAGAYQTQDRAAAVRGGGLDLATVGQQEAALAGKPLVAANEFGSTNLFTGRQDATGPAAVRFGAYRDATTGAQKANAAQSYAAAEASRAQAKKYIAEAGEPGKPSKDDFKDTTAIRKEFEDRTEVKNFRQAMPVLEAARKAPDTPQGDLQLIYGVGKVLDPNSVVREGEMALVVKSGSPAERIDGFINYLQGGGRLSPKARARLVTALESRTREYQRDYDAARRSYDALARRRGLDPSEIFMNDRTPEAGGDRTVVRTGTLNGRKVVQYSDGTTEYAD